MAKPEPTKTEAPETEATAPFQHDGKRVFLLVPADSKERDITLKHLEEHVFPACEKLPHVTADLQLKRFRGDEVIYVAHPIDDRIKSADGRFSQGVTVHLSAPAEMSGMLAMDAEGFTTLSPQDAFKAVCRLPKATRAGRCYYVKTAGEDESQLKLVDY